MYLQSAHKYIVYFHSNDDGLLIITLIITLKIECNTVIIIMIKGKTLRIVPGHIEIVIDYN